MHYFDHAASTQCPDFVQDVMREAYDEYGNVHRGIHRHAVKTTDRYECARSKVANFINADSDEIAFTHGTTESINLIALGLEWKIKPSDEILVTQMDHHSNLAPWQALAYKTNAKLRTVAINKDGFLDLDDLRDKINSCTKILAFPSISNVLGTVLPVSMIVNIAREVDALTVVDAAQSVGHMPIDVKAWDADFVAFSGHKMYAPTGIGVLYSKRFDLLEPTFVGGGMVHDVSYDNFDYDITNRMLECGTPPIMQAIALGAATDWICFEKGWNRIQNQEKHLTEYAFRHLEEWGANIIGPTRLDKRGPLLSFNVGDIHPHDVASILDEFNVAVRAGHHCAQPLHHALRLRASVRASFNFQNMEWEIDKMIDALSRVHAYLKRRSP
jgi:cysteine desulfurase/selenocysteine lyase